MVGCFPVPNVVKTITKPGAAGIQSSSSVISVVTMATNQDVVEPSRDSAMMPNILRNTIINLEY